ncbi:hypothetical protein OL229_05160 [Neisseriaceae bacterium JH1-16]|nr:hypothetical protein [Neisseriaceae bacterium JH1-16]
MSAAGVLRAVPPTVWLIAAGGLAAWWIARKAVNVGGEVIDHVSEAVSNAVKDVPHTAHNVVSTMPPGTLPIPGVQPGVWLWDHAGQAINAVNGARDTVVGWFTSPDNALRNKLAGHTLEGNVWYGYDRTKAAKDAKAAANSQIAKDVQKYGGGYGGLTH